MTKVYKILNFSVLGLIIVFTISSCATIMVGITDTMTYPLNVITNNPETRVLYNGTEFNVPAKIDVTRSKSVLQIALIADSVIKKNFTVEPRLNAWFCLGNPLQFLYLAPITWGIDLTNPRRFTYGKHIFLDFYDTTTVIRPKLMPELHHFLTRPYPSQQGQINLLYSYPLVNNFHFKPQSEPSKTLTGCLGIGLGVESFYTNTKSLQVKADAVIDFLLPFPAPVDYWSDRESVDSWYISITDNWKVRRFTFGYGGNYAENTWRFIPYPEYDDLGNLIPKREFTRKTNQTLGFTFNSYFQLLRGLYLGVVYRPSIYQLSPQRGFIYEHVFTFDALFKIRLRSGY